MKTKLKLNLNTRTLLKVTVLLLALITISTTTAAALSCTCGDICVNTSGWWRDSDAFNASGTPIQAAVNAASSGDTICVADGSYSENVNVNNRLTLTGAGAGVVTVTAASNDHVFYVTADYVNISGFNAIGATYTSAGIYLDGADHCNISENAASNNGHGIYLHSSSNNTLTSNNASYNYYGISLHSSSNHNTLTSNNASDNYYGIYLESSSNNTLTSNIANSNYGFGIYLHSSSNHNTLTSNNANSNYGHGIYLHSSSNNTLTSNIANSNYGFGIYLHSSSNHNTLTSNNANSNTYGIYLYYSSNNTLTSNNADSNNDYGIYLESSSNNTLTSNNASDNDYGIYLESSSNNTLTSNNASDNYYGIVLYSSSNNTLSNNTANSNYYGIFLYHLCNYNTLSNNTANSNYYHGIYLYDSNNNLIYNNYFNNTNNAYDDGTNIWNITKTAGLNIISGPYLGGNYWSDYSGEDTNEDGIGETLLPYNSSGNITTGGDWLPLVPVGVAPPNITSFAPPSPVNDTVCTWRNFNVTVNQTVNVSWYLNESFLFKNESVKEANYTLHAEIVGEHNVSAVAENANGTDMQTWVWNVKSAPDTTPATVDFDPDTLNKKSKGKWVTVYTELPAGYNVTDINVSTMMLNGTVPAELHPTEIGDYDSDGIPDLMVKFDRQAVIDILSIGDAVDITVTGRLTDGTPFEGSDTIRVIDKGKGK